ncbi:hypothetical protein PHLGIDRAFT_61879 [Phlebiopsis gigantea 11061_1 CR5-6]|uniref:N-acetyltransferase domain-containing protein n=1 Tax=Phlebiopsis gigantea (strain 11061_1 CR5-6) TaxID=745531 RepID=A0A0C3P3P2_PHLG1|nr:hypothetical protein PHLGIDRAFT_61879 [Phlebiopsis gigantea 11061_1 CR5-6]
MFQVQSLQANSPNVDETLPLLIQFSNSIFSPVPGTKYTSVAVWKQRLASPVSVILYVTAPPASPHITQDAIVAFLFAHPRTHASPLRTGETDTLHIWLAGVSPEHRKAGLLQQMVDNLSTRVVGSLTVCTIPARFPNMWGWLTKRGWEVERAWGEGKVLLSKSINPTVP